MKGIFIGIVLTLLIQLTGCHTFLTYGVMIFAKIGANVNPYTSTIILGVVQIAGSLLTTQLADSLGRKILLIISIIGSILGQMALAAFFYLDELGFDVTLFGWIPVASIGFVIFIASVGIVPLASICTVELLSPKVYYMIKNQSVFPAYRWRNCIHYNVSSICNYRFEHLALRLPQFLVIFLHSQ